MSIFRIPLYFLVLGWSQATHREPLVYTSDDQIDFVHPGIGFDIYDLKRMIANRDMEPWKSGYGLLYSSQQASLNYTMQGPFEVVGTPNVNLHSYESDTTAVLYQAIQWIMTNNSAYADKAIHILNAWTTTHTQWTGSPFLAATDDGLNFVLGAEILRYTYSNWTIEATGNCENYFQNMLWQQFQVSENTAMRCANQGAAQLKGAIAVAVFCNNQTKFDQTLDAWHNNECGGLKGNTIASGQNADSGRDQGHALGLIKNFAFVAETLWKQKIDLFAELDNRLLAISEYFMKYNLGNEVPFITFGACYGLYTQMGSSGRGNWTWSPIVLEIIRGAYVIRKGLAAPFTLQFLNITAPNVETFLYRKDLSQTINLTSVDIGNTNLTGSSSYANGIWIVNGSGDDIWGGFNNFHFAYQQMIGDGSIIAQIIDVQNTDPNASGGLMIRETLNADSPYATLHMKPETGGAEFYNRVIPNGPIMNQQIHQLASPLPYWLMLKRKGNLISASNSFDALTWTPMRVVAMPMNDTVYVGLAVCSHNKTILNTSIFSNVVVGIKSE